MYYKYSKNMGRKKRGKKPVIYGLNQKVNSVRLGFSERNYTQSLKE